jgi:RHS repeat-associated protein
MTEKSMGPSSTTWFYGYNDKNQMTSAIEKTTPTGTAQMTVTYDYDVFGNMIEEDVNTGGTTTVTRYALDGWDPGKPAPVGNENFDQLFQLNSSNGLVMRYVNGDNVDQVWARISSGGTAAWYWEDRLGSVRFMTDNSGVVQDQITYDGFGNVTTQTYATFSDQHLFAGGEWDSASQFSAHGVRFENLPDGRFTGPDPDGFAAGQDNLDEYVRNNPTNAVDPSGLEAKFLIVNTSAIDDGAVCVAHTFKLKVQNDDGKPTFWPGRWASRLAKAVGRAWYAGCRAEKALKDLLNELSKQGIKKDNQQLPWWGRPSGTAPPDESYNNLSAEGQRTLNLFFTYFHAGPNVETVRDLTHVANLFANKTDVMIRFMDKATLQVSLSHTWNHESPNAQMTRATGHLTLTGRFFEDKTDRQRAETIFHESTHVSNGAFSGTDDYVYLNNCSNPDDGYYFGDDFPTEDKDRVNPLNQFNMSGVRLRWNADSYAGFMTNYYEPDTINYEVKR